MAEERSRATSSPRVLAEFCRRLELAEFTVAGLHEASRRLLGAERTARCVDVIAGHHLSRRYWQVGNWASVVVAHTAPSAGHAEEYPDDRVLPIEWWTLPGSYPRYSVLGADDLRVRPDDVLFAHRFDHWEAPSEWRSILDIVAWRAQDDSMPPAHDLIDLNRGTLFRVDSVRADCTPLVVGDVVRLTYDPGYWVDATVTDVSARDGSEVPLAWARCVKDSYYSTFCAVANWAVDSTLRQQRVLLPGEVAGSATDPYARPLVLTDLVREFLTLAAARDAELGALLAAGTTFGDVHRVQATRDLARNGTELAISRGLSAVLDERPDLLETATDQLRDHSSPAGEDVEHPDG